MTRLGRYYRKRHVDYEKEVSGYFVSEGVAYIAMHAAGREDILSRYSVEGLPYLNCEFVSTLDAITEHIPEELPLVLELTGHRFTEEEQREIEKAVRAHYALRLGAYEYEKKGSRARVLWFFLYLAVFLALSLWNILPGSPAIEIAYLLFYSLGDRFLESVFLSRSSAVSEKLSLGQLSSLKILFTETYDPRQLTGEEAASLTEEVTKTAQSGETK